MSVCEYVVRPMRESELADLIGLREAAGPGFTSLQVSDEALGERLGASGAAFGRQVSAPGKERYVLALEHLPSGAVVGSAALKACVGESPPFFNFRLLKIAQASFAAQRRFDLEVLMLVNEFAGCTEVGSLFLRAEHRKSGVGRMLAQSRYMLMATEPKRFADTVVAELRGIVDASGYSPFWHALGRHFFHMSFEEADKMSAGSDSQFILDLMPRFPIYADMLPEAARAAIGKCHADGEAALRLLEWEGFRYDRVVDIFDGGPLVSCPRDTIRTLREARPRSLRVGEVGERMGLVTTGTGMAFRCVSAPVEVDEEYATISAETLKALEADEAAPCLVWCAA